MVFQGNGHHRDIHELTHSVPTRRSSDLRQAPPTHRRRRPKSPPPKRCRAADAKAERSGILPRPLSQAKRSEEHTTELKPLMRISYAVFCLTTIKRHTRVHKRQHALGLINFLCPRQPFGPRKPAEH